MFAAFAAAQTVPEPKDVVGFAPGENRKLASWSQIVDYFKRLDAASDRVLFEEIGKTTLGRPFVYATVSSPANLRNLGKYKQINKKLADPRLIKSDDKAAADLARQGKTIVLITFGIHSTEVGSTLSSMIIADRLARGTDDRVRKILDDTIILLVPSLNPDGVDIVKNWHDKTVGTRFEGTEPPELYHHYVGHDNNRDWYAFTQIETQLTVKHLHNEWHPQIVHDVHQMGSRGARIFLPPYLQPVEPNVPKQIVDGYTELGSFMADSMRKQGLQGITTDSIFDAWTPARAYSHYHGGVRILSETASARLATPVNYKFEDLVSGLGYDVTKEAVNFGPLWKGGDWGLPEITRYMTTAAFLLLDHAAANREAWLRRFYSIGKYAVRPRKAGETFAYIIDVRNSKDPDFLIGALRQAGVEVKDVRSFEYGGRRFADLTPVIKLNQPYSGFATAMIEPQDYPDLRDAAGRPIAPYDVTAHNLALLTGTKVIPVREPIDFKESQTGIGDGMGWGGSSRNHPVYLYRSFVPSMDEGWTRWVIDKNAASVALDSRRLIKVTQATNSHLKDPGIGSQTSVVVFPDQNPNQMLNGYAKGARPDEFTGGIGKDGVENLRKFVENGGTLVFFNRACDFAIEQFGLPVRDVTDGLSRSEFYIPGSILRTRLDTKHPLAKSMPAESIAWFENSPAFEITMSDDTNVEIIARYPEKKDDILLSGWALGADKLAGKAALVSINIGKGRIILFGFRPQYRGQSTATFPLMFNAMTH